MPKKEGFSLGAPARRIAPFTERSPRRMAWAPVAGRRHYDKRPGAAGALAAVTGAAP